MIDRLIHKIKFRQAELKEAMCNGVLKDFEAYQRMVGEYQGLETTLIFINTILEEDEDKE
jgi:hypothetical protein